MTGWVFDIPIQGRHNNYRHPQVVVLELAEECWIVPAFSADGKEVTLDVDSFELAGYPRDHIYVALDNSEHVRWSDGRSGKPAKWIIARASKRAKTQILAHNRAGTMLNSGLLPLCEQLLALANNSDLHSPHFKKKLGRLINELKS